MIGIGVSTYQRYDQLSEICKSLASLSKNRQDIKLCVADDGSSKTQKTHGIPLIKGFNKGVSINKNRLLYYLKDCELIFILEDDVLPLNLNFIDKFKESNLDFLSFGPIHEWNLWKITKKENGKVFYTTTIKHEDCFFYTPGSFTAIKNSVLSKIGGLSADFIGLGMEHMEWAWRAYKARLSDDNVSSYCTLDLFDSFEFLSVPRNKRNKAQSDKNLAVYRSMVDNWDRMDQDYLDPSKLYLDNKVFGVGLSKTGTTSLNKALNILGYKACHYPISDEFYRQLMSGDLCLDLFDDFNAITDITPIPFFKKLDALYPFSKFILTNREKEEWLRSIFFHFNKSHSKSPINKNWNSLHPLTKFLLKEVYELPLTNETLSRSYDKHLDLIRGYFNDRDNFLEINVKNGWGDLCKFCCKPTPELSFPHENKSQGRVPFL